MESLLPSRFTPAAPSPLRPYSSLRLPPRPRRHPIRLSSNPRGFNTTTNDDGDEVNHIKDDPGYLLQTVLDAYKNSDNSLQTFLRNLLEADIIDESVMGADEKESLMRALLDADLPRSSSDIGLLWKIPAVAVVAFAGVPALLRHLGDAAGVPVPAWMPLVYSVTSFLIGSLLVADASVPDEELEEWLDRRERAGALSFLESETVVWRVARRLPAVVLAASMAGAAAMHAAGVVTALDLQTPWWVAFLLFGLCLGVPYGVFSASFDPEVKGSLLGWDEFVKNTRDVILLGHDRSKSK